MIGLEDGNGLIDMGVSKSSPKLFRSALAAPCINRPFLPVFKVLDWVYLAMEVHRD